MEKADLTSARAAYHLGFWGALFSLIFGAMYIAAELAHLLGLLGVHDSPQSLVIRMTPSLFLPIAFIVLIGAIHATASQQDRVWTQIALAFAIIYAVFVSFVYFTQITVAVPLALQGDADKYPLLEFTFGTFMFAVDILGYAFMSLATLFAAPVFKGDGLERWIRWALVANGCLAAPIALQIIFQPLWYAAAIWVVTFPVTTILLAIWFRQT